MATGAARREVVILGTGTMLGGDLTVRFRDALTAAARIFTIVREPAGLWLPKDLATVELQSLNHLYSNAESRVDNYLRVGRYVVDAAAGGGTTALVTYGSPVVYDRVTSVVRNLCEANRILCRVIPAVSSIDSMMAVLGEDIAPGIQICEARWLVKSQIPMTASLQALLFQVGIAWTDGLARTDDATPDKLAELKHYLLRFYPPAHPAVFLRAPGFDGDAGYRRATPLARLDMGFVDDLLGTSLYLPAAGVSPGGSRVWDFTARDESLEADALADELASPWDAAVQALK